MVSLSERKFRKKISDAWKQGWTASWGNHKSVREYASKPGRKLVSANIFTFPKSQASFRYVPLLSHTHAWKCFLEKVHLANIHFACLCKENGSWSWQTFGPRPVANIRSVHRLRMANTTAERENVWVQWKLPVDNSETRVYMSIWNISVQFRIWTREICNLFIFFNLANNSAEF